MKQIETFNIVGIEVETTNQDGKAAEDLGALWGRFFAENVSGKIMNKKSEDIYSIYTDYGSDYTGKYKSIIGMLVDSIDEIPKDLIGRKFEGGKYQKFIARGEMPNAVVEKWQEIWTNDKQLNRKYTADFEVYGSKSQNGQESEVEIFIALK